MKKKRMKNGGKIGQKRMARAREGKRIPFDHKLFKRNYSNSKIADIAFDLTKRETSSKIRNDCGRN